MVSIFFRSFKEAKAILNLKKPMEALNCFLAEQDAPSQYFTDTKPEHVEKWVKDQIQDTTQFDIIVFSKTTCSFCQRALRLIHAMNVLSDLRLKVKVFDLNQTDASLIQPVLEQITQQKTVPNIFIDGKHVGGYNDLCKIFKTIVEKATL